MEEVDSNMATTFFYNNQKLGILGGGQLGKMLIQEALNYNMYTCVLDSDKNAPCKSIANEFTVGKLSDFDAVYNFGKNVDVLTIEIEHVNADALEKLQQEGVKVYPQPQVLKTIQDKGLQKLFYKSHAIPTAEFYLIDNKTALDNYTHLLPFILKTRKGGYDGKGVMKLSSKNDFANAFDEPCVIETLVNIKKEVAVIVARNANGECKAFPLVDMEFNKDANLVEFLYAPAEVEEEIQLEAEHIAVSIAKSLQIVGLLAVELFITEDNKVLVNEVAPRPHNSGHHTIEANITSQFEQHLRAIHNLPLGATDTILPAVMINLLGEQGYEGPVYVEGMEEMLNINGAYMHLYGKTITKPYRKMGHVTIVDENIELAKQKARKIKDLLKIKTLTQP